MHQLIKPKKLNPGDTIATISLSGGRAGDPDMIERTLRSTCHRSAPFSERNGFFV